MGGAKGQTTEAPTTGPIGSIHSDSGGAGGREITSTGMGGAKGKIPSPVHNMMPSIGGVQLPNPLNPIGAGGQILAQLIGGRTGAKMDPVSAIGAKSENKVSTRAPVKKAGK